jgi:alkanesulfonate monooxygenase SsuD/methylene tetrahydromethanopterin reductase-like flavin-dependent oxidoreductase (luciferase family)
VKIELTEGDLKLSLPPADLLDIVRRMEDLGFDGLGFPDLVRYGLDVFAFFGAAALQTSRLTLFPNVSNPITRSPWVLANICATLGRLAPGRFRLTVGAGTLLNLGRPPARIAEMRAAISTIRGLLAGEPLPLLAPGADGEQSAVSRAAAGDRFAQIHAGGLIRPPREYVPPVCMAAGGPRMIELAGEVADQAMILTGHSGPTVTATRNLLATGASRVGRSLDGFEIAHWAFVRVDDDEDAAYEYLTQELARYPIGTHISPITLEALGMEWPLDRLQDVPAAEWRRFIDAVAFAGPAEKIAERFQDVARAGVLDRIVCGISGPDRDVALNRFARTVIPSLK